MLKRRLVVVRESGIFTHADVVQFQEAGTDPILVGETPMREANIGAKMRQLLGR